MKGKSLLILSSIVCLILVLTILLFLPACTSGPTADKPLTLRYSCGLPPVDQQVKDAEWFADEVNRRTEGRVIIEVYSGAELFDVNAGPEATIMGSVDMCQASPVSGVLPEYNSVLKLTEVAFNNTGGDFGQDWVEIFCIDDGTGVNGPGLNLNNFFFPVN